MVMKSLFGIVVSTLLVACSQTTVIESQKSPQPVPTGSVTSVSYFLPRQMAKVTVESKKTTLNEVEKARQAFKAANELSDKNPRNTLLKDGMELAKKKYDQLKKSHDGETCTQSAKFELLGVEPDPEHHYIANVKHGWSRDDVIELNFKDGFLSGAETTTSDRSLDIVLEGVKSIASGFPLRSGVEVSVLEKKATNGQEDKTSKETCNAFVRSVVIDPTEGVTKAIKNVIDGTKLLVKIDVPNVVRGHVDKKVNGLVYRRRLPYVVTICEKKGSNGDDCGTNMQQALYRLPDSKSDGYIPIKSGHFVTTKHSLKFEQGAPTLLKIDQQSELRALATFPLTLAKAILSVPAELIQFKIDYTSKEAELITEQKALIAAQQELLKAQSGDSE